MIITRPIISFSIENNRNYVTINGRKSVTRDNGYGYIYTSYPGCTGTVGLHRIIIELHIGRKLRSDEHIHHIDGNKSNNSLSNLTVVNGCEHNREHTRERNWKHDPLNFCCSVCASTKRKHKAKTMCGNCYSKWRKKNAKNS